MNQNDLQVLIDANNLTPLQAQALASASGCDPSRVLVACESPLCRNRVAIGDSWSFTTHFCTTGPAVTDAGHHIPGGLQCPDQQHYGCSRDCARHAAVHCLDNHMPDLHAKTAATIRANVAAAQEMKA